MAGAHAEASRAKVTSTTVMMSPATRQRVEEKRSKRRMMRELLWSVRHVLPMLLFVLTGFAVLLPIVPLYITNYFAAQAAGHPIVCQDYAAGKKPEACLAGSGTAAQVNSILSAIGSAGAIITAPLVGALSDVYGRRAFIAVTCFFGIAPIFLFATFVMGWTSPYPYYAAQGVNNMLPLPSVVLSYIADIVSPANRAAGFGLVLATVSVGVIIGPLVGGAISVHSSLIVAIAASAFGFLYAVFMIPESLPLDARKKFDYSVLNPFSVMSILLRSSLFRRLTLVVLFNTMCLDGTQTVLVFYLQSTFNFGRVRGSYALRQDPVVPSLEISHGTKALERLDAEFVKPICAAVTAAKAPGGAGAAAWDTFCQGNKVKFNLSMAAGSGSVGDRLREVARQHREHAAARAAEVAWDSSPQTMRDMLAGMAWDMRDMLAGSVTGSVTGSVATAKAMFVEAEKKKVLASLTGS